MIYILVRKGGVTQTGKSLATNQGDSLRPPGAGKANKGYPLEPPKGVWPY